VNEGVITPAFPSESFEREGKDEQRIFNERSEYKNSASRTNVRDRILMIYFVYILQCSDKTLYVGCTNNLEKRLEQHNNSKSGAHYTKIRRPVKLLYSETFQTLKEARGRELEIKSWRRAKKLNLLKWLKK
jgi:putative endonuclease